MRNRSFLVFVITIVLLRAIYKVYIDFYFDVNKIIVTQHETTSATRKSVYGHSGEDFLVNTPGCYIPNYGKTMVFNESQPYNTTCGERAIFIKRLANDKITFKIDDKILKKYYTKKKYACCYRFVTRSKISGKEDTQLNYTQCQTFKNGAEVYLKEEILTVLCDVPKTKKAPRRIVYEDAYIFVKKVFVTKNLTDNEKWNVIIVGMDTMSRARMRSSMPSTVKYLQEHGWLDYRGYNKIDYNTLPNVVAMLTGKKLSAIDRNCESGMHKCNDLLLWSRFRDAGYITAYAEDFLSLPDTFSRYKGFQTPPTHHYMRPFFLIGEKRKGNLMCTKHKPSIKHLLDYAQELVTTYRKNGFFGVFWLNSYSHDKPHNPTLLDNDMVGFLDQLRKSDVTNNTIIIMLSDHGIRYGDMRVQKDSYYDERLPMLYIWIPHNFRNLHKRKYYNLHLNQHRLLSPYDLYLTLAEILEEKKIEIRSEACPKCESLFREVSLYRTCPDAGISDNWCSCHNMTEIGSEETGVSASLQVVVKHIQNIAKSARTIKRMTCSSLQLGTVLRTHTYIGNGGKIHYLVALRMSPGNVGFEATVVTDGDDYTVLTPVRMISPYNRHSNCVLDANYRPFCYCKMA